jgi:hypothetical protein
MMLLHTKNNWSPSLPRRKPKLLEANAAAHQKRTPKTSESLPLKKNAQLLDTKAAAFQTQCHQHLTEEENKIAIQIKPFAATLSEKIDLDQPTNKFLRDHFYKGPTLKLAYYDCCSWLIIIVALSIHVQQYSMMNWDQTLKHQPCGTEF